MRKSKYSKALYYTYMLAALLSLISVFVVKFAHAEERLIRVGIVDSGLDVNDPRFSGLLCNDFEHRSFTGTSLYDDVGHGTAMAGLIKEYAGPKAKYCLMIVKFIGTTNTGLQSAYNYSGQALTYIVTGHPDIVNLSLYGEAPSAAEYAAISFNPSIMFFAASGNQGLDLTKYPRYPANYALVNLFSVGSTENNKISSFSNYPANFYEKGKVSDLLAPDFMCSSEKPAYTCLQTLEGTSISTAIRTGKAVKALSEKYNNTKHERKYE